MKGKQVLGLKQHKKAKWWLYNQYYQCLQSEAFWNGSRPLRFHNGKNVSAKNRAKHLKIWIKVMNELNQDPKKNTDRIRILIFNIECALSSGYLPMGEIKAKTTLNVFLQIQIFSKF